MITKKQLAEILIRQFGADKETSVLMIRELSDYTDLQLLHYAHLSGLTASRIAAGIFILNDLS